MVDFAQHSQHHYQGQQEQNQLAANRYELDEPSEVDPDAPMHQTSESSEYDQNDNEVTKKGAAISKMKKLAQKIYDTTPGIEIQFPKKQSKILTGIKHEEEVGAKRAQNFLNKCDQITDLRKQRKPDGSIADGDLTLEVAAQDWPHMYEKNYQIYVEAFKKSQELEETKNTKQENYIYREQEYRQVITDLKTTIETISQKPLQRARKASEDQLQVEGINLKLKQNENGGGNFEDNNDDNNFANKQVWEKKPERKVVDDIWNNVDDIDTGIKDLKNLTKLILAGYKTKLCKKLDSHYTKYRNELMADSMKKRENDEDPFVREQSLNEQLELMTQMAQTLDKEHRKLKNQEQRLKIQYSSQEKDSDLLIKQIIYYKKQHKQMKEEQLRLKEEIDKNRKEEEQTDRMLASKLDKQQVEANDQAAKNNNGRPMAGRKSTAQNSMSAFGTMVNQSSKAFYPAMPVHPSVAQINNAPPPRAGTVTGTKGGYRPKTAGLMPQQRGKGASAVRPQTGAVGQVNGLPVKNSLSRFQQAGVGAARAASAGFSHNQKLQRCEGLITRFKKKLEEERRLLRMMKTLSAQEIETKNLLEKILRQCVDDVKAEINKKKSENRSSYYARGKKGKQELMEERNLTSQEREKIVEVLMSQERVLTLLYDKTFPPRSQSVGFTGQLGNQFNLKSGNLGLGSQSTKNIGTGGADSMRQFNYYGSQPGARGGGAFDDEDVEQLEREIETVMMRKVETAKQGGGALTDHNIVNMTTQNKIRLQTASAAEGKRRRKIQTGSVGQKKSSLLPPRSAVYR